MTFFRSVVFASGLTFTASVVTSPVSAADLTLKLAGMLPVEHYSTQVLEEVAEEIRGAGVGLDVKTYPSWAAG